MSEGTCSSPARPWPARSAGALATVVLLSLPGVAQQAADGDVPRRADDPAAAAPRAADAVPVLTPGAQLTLQLSPGEVRELTVAAAGAGRLHVWASSDALDPRLVLRRDGRELAANADADASGTAWVRHDERWSTDQLVTAVLTVEARRDAPAGGDGLAFPVTLGAALEHDDPAARERAAADDEVLERAAGRLADGDGAAAAALVDELLARWRDDPLLAGWMGTPAWLDRAARRCLEWGLAERAVDWQALRVEQLLARRPPTWIEPALARRDLAAALRAAGRPGEAANVLAEAARGLAAALPAPDPVQLELALERVDACYAAGRLDEALAALADHRTLLTALDREDDATAWSTRSAWAEALARQGAAAAVRPVVEECAAQLARLLPAGDFARTQAESQRAVVCTLAGDAAEACRILAGLIAHADAEQADDHWLGAVLRLQYGRALVDAGRPATARRVAEEALELLGRLDLRPDEVAVRGQAWGLLADAQLLQGDGEAAAVSLDRALPDLEAGLGPGHLEVLEVRRTRAYLYWEDGYVDVARESFARLADGPADGSPRARAVRWTARGYEAFVLVTLGRADEARELLTDLLASDPGTGVTEKERLTVEHVLARALLADGEPDAALERSADLLPRLEARPELIDLYWHTLGLEAEARLAAGDGPGAEVAARRLIAALSARLDGLVLEASQRELEAAPVAHAAELGQLTRVALSRPGLVDETVALCERLRGLGLATARMVRRPPVGETVRALQQDWRAAERALVAAGAGDDELALDEARQRRDRTQRQLVRALGVAGQHASLRADDLPAGTLALGYLTVVGADGTPELVATLRRRGEPSGLVHLGPLDRVRTAVTCWRAAVGVHPFEVPACEDGSIKARGAALAALVLEPLASWIDAADELLILPDDLLHLVPLDALPWDDGLLGDEHRCRRGWGVSDAAAPADDGSLLLVGALDYGPPADEASSRAAGEPGPFAPLPASADELDTVAAWRTRHGPDGADLRRLVGASADPATLAEAAAGVSTLHLSTHAWARPVSVGLGGDWLAGASSARSLAPLLATGLALSGANRRASGRLDGEQLAGLDLEACRLAVLAGCATNVGAPRTWQGVASLTKAAHMAGARVVVASLWPVEDRWTRRLMDVFYQGLWAQGLSPEEALWRARQVVREEGLYPRRWAGWVLSRVGPND